MVNRFDRWWEKTNKHKNKKILSVPNLTITKHLPSSSSFLVQVPSQNLSILVSYSLASCHFYLTVFALKDLFPEKAWDCNAVSLIHNLLINV